MSVDPHERRYLAYIQESVHRILAYRPATREEFLTSPLVQDAIVWRLQTIADAARYHLTDELKARHPEIRWRAVYGFRNIAAHGYAGLNLDLVWEIADRHLTALLETVTAELVSG